MSVLEIKGQVHALRDIHKGLTLKEQSLAIGAFHKACEAVHCFSLSEVLDFLSKDNGLLKKDQRKDRVIMAAPNPQVVPYLFRLRDFSSNLGRFLAPFYYKEEIPWGVMKKQEEFVRLPLFPIESVFNRVRTEHLMPLSGLSYSLLPPPERRVLDLLAFDPHKRGDLVTILELEGPRLVTILKFKEQWLKDHSGE